MISPFLSYIDDSSGYIVAAIAIVAFCISLYLFISQRKVTQRLVQEKTAIEDEELRMFEFMHLLGMAIEEAHIPKKLHQEIVQGIVQVLNAEGGAIYLADNDYLVPEYITDSCPPVIGIPSDLVEKMENPQLLQSHMRLTKVSFNRGVLGDVATTKKPQHVRNLSEHPAFLKSKLVYKRNVEALIAPMFYSGKMIGVIAVVSESEQKSFSKNDFAVFCSIVEQSAFALGNAMIHREVSERRQIDSELRAARSVQRILMPMGSPEIPGYRVFGTNTPARIISGDYYDYIKRDDGKWAIAIADVSGKGMAAGLLMTICRTLLRVSLESQRSAVEALARVNRVIAPDIKEDMFISLALVELVDNKGNIQLVRAGHDAPLLYRRQENSIEVLKPGGLAIGIDDGDVFERITQGHDYQMKSGDCLLLYTDGVNEAVNAEDEEFGKDNLHEHFKKSAVLGAEGAIKGIQSALKDFVGDQKQMDDITMIAIEKR